ncbi:hypothetical protein, partial [Leucobacter sp. M11]|uniref:hypothetical protein n=1 Tax=Leucobacter sp. M11 TaxID=2993565 RepID=UPI002D7F784E
LPAPPALSADRVHLSTERGQLVYRGTGAVPHARVEIRGERSALAGEDGGSGDPGMSPRVVATATVHADGSWEAPPLAGFTPIGLTLSLRQVNPDAAALASPWFVHVADQMFSVAVPNLVGSVSLVSPSGATWVAHGVPGATWGVRTPSGEVRHGIFDERGTATVTVPLRLLPFPGSSGADAEFEFGYAAGGGVLVQERLSLPPNWWSSAQPEEPPTPL